MKNVTYPPTKDFRRQAETEEEVWLTRTNRDRRRRVWFAGRGRHLGHRKLDGFQSPGGINRNTTPDILI